MKSKELLSLGQTDPQAILAGMKEKYPKASVVLTLGADGAYCLHDGRTLYQPAFRVKAVDTTAAGDTFTGYFVSGLAQGHAHGSASWSALHAPPPSR